VNYTVRLESSAERELKRLPRDILRRIDAKLQSLAENPRPRGVTKLKGSEGEGWRVRIGNYRILYTIDDKVRVVSVYRIRPRPTAYR
jgi:mRNA interferase RelE/StbE